MKVLITGANGLIGSEAVRFFDRRGHDLIGVDNNMRRNFFGPKGDTTWVLESLRREIRRYRHEALDIRDRDAMDALWREVRPDLVVHCAAQPSHDLAARRPLDDFDVNAYGTMNLLEATRRHAPEAVFVHMSSNKVYGDGPNQLPLVELETRWDYAESADRDGIAEDFPIDRCLHSLFGASKVAGGVMAQEYGRYYGLRTGIFRGGCLTGPSHSGVELHGFLNYLIRVARRDDEYTIFGYGGKQVRDQIHSADVLSAIAAFAADPRPGEVYNLGGGRDNSASLLECIALVEERLGRKMRTRYLDEPRRGDHICYISNLGKFREHYPDWQLRYSLPDILEDLLG